MPLDYRSCSSELSLDQIDFKTKNIYFLCVRIIYWTLGRRFKLKSLSEKNIRFFGCGVSDQMLKLLDSGQGSSGYGRSIVNRKISFKHKANNWNQFQKWTQGSPEIFLFLSQPFDLRKTLQWILFLCRMWPDSRKIFLSLEKEPLCSQAATRGIEANASIVSIKYEACVLPNLLLQTIMWKKQNVRIW